jgi:hypothetical protein
MRTNVILEKKMKKRRKARKRQTEWKLKFGFSKTKTYTHSHRAQVGAQLIFKRSSFKIEEKQETTNICCILRGYFLFHVVTMLNNNSTNKGFRYHVSLKVLSDMFFERKTRKFWRRRIICFLQKKTFILCIMLQVVTSSFYSSLAYVYKMLRNLFFHKSE